MITCHSLSSRTASFTVPVAILVLSIAPAGDSRSGVLRGPRVPRPSM